MKFFAFLTLLSVLFTPLPAHPQEAAPKPSQHPAHELELKKQAAEEKKKSLERDAQSLSLELKNTQSTLVDIAAKIKKNESRLNILDVRIKETTKEKNDIEERLKKDKSSIGDLILALERLNRTPAEAVIARPGAPLETAQSAMLLQSILPDIYTRAERLKTDLSRLEELVLTLQVDKADAKKTTDDLQTKRDELSDVLKTRKKLYEQTSKGIQDQDKALKDISVQSKNLKDLVERLAIRQRQQLEERTKQAAINNQGINRDLGATRPNPRPTPMPKAGVSQLPVSGVIRIGYKETDDIGAESQGLTIESRSGGLVVAPMGGIVRYAGTFKNYGQIIIVEHQKDYHSLIAGLARIDTVVGQSVVAGEPVGILPKTSNNGGNPTLYYELRFNGEPVNPSRKFSGL